MKNLAKAVLKVMSEVKGIDKSMTVGSGKMQYQGVPDQEVKKIVGESMSNNGLCLLPIDVTPTYNIERWEETNQYGTKQKQSVFTEVTTKYLLLHESGESLELSGYGHGVDSQDKSAGKATTYALKYLMLYTFLIPTGKIDDSDNTHSNDLAQPVKKKLALSQERFQAGLDKVNSNEITKEQFIELCSKYTLTDTQSKSIMLLKKV